ncbi:MAG: trigger factor [Alistipes sp.]|jgi:trigger factor|nr:trigger factor [Alistipes sp.]
MNLSAQQSPDGVLTMKITVGEADYAAEVDKNLREMRRKANVPGFRPGMVPMGLINKMYRKGAVAEQAYRKANEAAFKHLEENKINIVGDVMPSDEQGELDFGGEVTDFEFVFDAGVAPTVELTLGDDDKLTYYRIEPTDEMRSEVRANITRRFGHLEDTDKVTGDEAMEVTLDGATTDGSELHADDAFIGLVSMTDEERKPFIGKKVGDVMKVDVREVYKNPQQLSAILGVKAEELDTVAPEFTATVKRIRRFAEPVLDADFFTAAFPDGKVTDEAGFDKYVEEMIVSDLANNSDYLFAYQLKNHLLAKAGLRLPEAFLKNWLHAVNEGKFSMEEIERDFAAFLRMMSWDLILRHFSDTMGLEVTQEELLGEAKALARMQFAQYGMSGVPDETLESYGKQMLSSREEAQKIYERVREDKILSALKPLIKVSEKGVSKEEFEKLAAEN